MSAPPRAHAPTLRNRTDAPIAGEADRLGITTSNLGIRIREAIIQRLEREADAGADWNGRSEHGGIGKRH